jgi:hypothetical protein
MHAVTKPMPPKRLKQIWGVDFFVGLAILVAAAWIAFGHFRSAYDFTIKDRLTQCEQPLNNRCDYVYRVREATGEEHVIGLAEFRPDSADLATGNSIRKRKDAFSYFVNGREVQWPQAWLFTAAVALALLLLGSSLYRSRRARRRL